jgi:hypothetical protein
LGNKFAKTFFPIPGSRIEIRIAILQRVVNDPYTSHKTRNLALEEFGKIDYPKLYEENKRYSVSSTRNLFLNQEQIERKKKMPVPILGHATLPRKTLKLVKSLIGQIGQWGRCDMSDFNSRHITTYLKELCPLITKEQLAESSAYALLLTVTKGETYNLVLNSMDSGERPKNLTLALHQIIGLWDFTGDKDDLFQVQVVEESTLLDMRKLIHTHFASQASGIELNFNVKIAAQAQEHRKMTEMNLEAPVLLPGYMLYMEAVREFVKPEIIERKETKSPFTGNPTKRAKSVDYPRNKTRFRNNTREKDRSHSHFAPNTTVNRTRSRTPVEMYGQEGKQLDTLRVSFSDTRCKLCNLLGHQARNC